MYYIGCTQFLLVLLSLSSLAVKTANAWHMCVRTYVHMCCKGLINITSVSVANERRIRV